MIEKNFILDAIVEKEEKDSVSPDASSKRKEEIAQLHRDLVKWENYVARDDSFKSHGKDIVEEVKKQLRELGEEIPEESSEKKPRGKDGTEETEKVEENSEEKKAPSGEAKKERKGFIEVKVLRSSGEIEDGWSVADIKPDESGYIRVFKFGSKDSDTLKKKVPFEDLAKWNGWKTDNSKTDAEKDKANEEKEKEKIIPKVDAQDAGFAKADRSNIEDAEFVEVGPQRKQQQENNLVAIENKRPEPSREERIAQLKNEVEEARKEFLEVDYKKNAALTRVRKFFFGNKQYDINKDDNRHTPVRQDENGKYLYDPEKEYDASKSGQNVDKTDYDIQWYRAQYDNKLFKLQELLIEDAEKKGSTDEQLAEIMTYFNVEKRANMAAAHDEVKIEQEDGNLKRYLGEKTAGKLKGVSEKMVGFSKNWQTLSGKKKLAIAAGIAVTGWGAVAVGAIGVGTFAGITIAKLTTMGILNGTGMAWRLEAKGQMEDRGNVEKQKQIFLEQIKNMSEDDKYKLLRKNVKDVAIKDERNELNKIKNQDVGQLAIAAAYGTILGGIAPELFKHYGGSMLHWAGEKLGLAGHVNAPGINPTHAHGHMENLNINKGSNFSATLMKELHNPDSDFYKARPDLKGHNPQEILNKVLADFKATHPEMHGHNPDYVLANSKIHFNPQTLHAELDDGKYGWYENVPAAHPDIPAPHDVVPAPTETIPAPPPPIHEAMPTPPAPVAETIPPPPPVHGPVYGSIFPPMPPADLPLGGAPEIFIQGHINLGHFAGMGHGQALREMRVNMFHNPEHFRHLKDMPVLNENGKLNIHEMHQAGLSADRHEIIKKFATSQQYPEMRPRVNESFGNWSTRATATVVNHANAGGGRHR